MPAIDMQMRLAELVKGSDAEPLSHDHFKLFTPDLHPDDIPDLCT